MVSTRQVSVEDDDQDPILLELRHICRRQILQQHEGRGRSIVLTWKRMEAGATGAAAAGGLQPPTRAPSPRRPISTPAARQWWSGGADVPARVEIMAAPGLGTARFETRALPRG
jgi:hypothetical protein